MKYFSVVYSAIFAPYAGSSGDFGVVYFGLTALDRAGAVAAPPPLSDVDRLRSSLWAEICAEKTKSANTAHTRLKNFFGDMIGLLKLWHYTSRAQRKPEIIQRSCA